MGELYGTDLLKIVTSIERKRFFLFALACDALMQQRISN